MITSLLFLIWTTSLNLFWKGNEQKTKLNDFKILFIGRHFEIQLTH